LYLSVLGDLIEQTPFYTSLSAILDTGEKTLSKLRITNTHRLMDEQCAVLLSKFALMFCGSECAKCGFTVEDH